METKSPLGDATTNLLVRLDSNSNPCFFRLCLLEMKARFKCLEPMSGRTGHLWQNRFFACGLSAGHLCRALAYVDRNPVRAGLVAKRRRISMVECCSPLDGS